ncbi:MAG: hypothetical protein ACTSVL_06750 [Promethearchaeota archaeon]
MSTELENETQNENLETPFKNICLNEPDFKNFKIHEKDHVRRIQELKKELQIFAKISQKTLNKQFTI